MPNVLKGHHGHFAYHQRLDGSEALGNLVMERHYLKAGVDGGFVLQVDEGRDEFALLSKRKLCDVTGQLVHQELDNFRTGVRRTQESLVALENVADTSNFVLKVVQRRRDDFLANFYELRVFDHLVAVDNESGSLV